MAKQARNPQNTQISEEAAEWLVDFRAGDVDAPERKRFYAWLRTSPEHVRAYLEVAAIWNEGPELDAARGFAAADLEALTRAEPNVVAFDSAKNRGRANSAQARTKLTRRFAVAASLVVSVTGLASWLYLQRDTYSTGLGEQRSVALADGSTVELNSGSRIRIRYGGAQRRVDLLEGQALFQVAKDSARPFVVHIGELQVKAVGTQFDVYRKKAQTVVTVLEGRVAESLDPQHEVLIAAGQQLATAHEAAEIPRPVPANTAAAMAWTQRQLIFESARLAEVASEFNRYNRRRLVIEDAVLDDLEISGVFSSTDARSLVNFLRVRPGVAIVETAGEIRVSRQNNFNVGR